MTNKPDGIVLTAAQMRSRRQRSIAIALGLGVLAAMSFAITLIDGSGMLNRPL